MPFVIQKNSAEYSVRKGLTIDTIKLTDKLTEVLSEALKSFTYRICCFASLKLSV